MASAVQLTGTPASTTTSSTSTAVNSSSHSGSRQVQLELTLQLGERSFGMSLAQRHQSLGPCYTVVSSIFPNSPASRAGIQEGWVVLRINGKPMEGLSISQVAAHFRNVAQTRVTLEICETSCDVARSAGFAAARNGGVSNSFAAFSATRAGAPAGDAARICIPAGSRPTVSTSSGSAGTLSGRAIAAPGSALSVAAPGPKPARIKQSAKANAKAMIGMNQQRQRKQVPSASESLQSTAVAQQRVGVVPPAAEAKTLRLKASEAKASHTRPAATQISGPVLHLGPKPTVPAEPGVSRAPQEAAKATGPAVKLAAESKTRQIAAGAVNGTVPELSVRDKSPIDAVEGVTKFAEPPAAAVKSASQLSATTSAVKSNFQQSSASVSAESIEPVKDAVPGPVVPPVSKDVMPTPMPNSASSTTVSPSTILKAPTPIVPAASIAMTGTPEPADHLAVTIPNPAIQERSACTPEAAKRLSVAMAITTPMSTSSPSSPTKVSVLTPVSQTLKPQPTPTPTKRTSASTAIVAPEPTPVQAPRPMGTPKMQDSSQPAPSVAGATAIAQNTRAPAPAPAPFSPPATPCSAAGGAAKTPPAKASGKKRGRPRKNAAVASNASSPTNQISRAKPPEARDTSLEEARLCLSSSEDEPIAKKTARRSGRRRGRGRGRGGTTTPLISTPAPRPRHSLTVQRLVNMGFKLEDAEASLKEVGDDLDSCMLWIVSTLEERQFTEELNQASIQSEKSKREEEEHKKMEERETLAHAKAFTSLFPTSYILCAESTATQLKQMLDSTIGQVSAESFLRKILTKLLKLEGQSIRWYKQAARSFMLQLAERLEAALGSHDVLTCCACVSESDVQSGRAKCAFVQALCEEERALTKALFAMPENHGGVPVVFLQSDETMHFSLDDDGFEVVEIVDEE